MKNELLHYLQQQIRTTDQRLKRFTCHFDGKKYPKRFIFSKLKNYIDDFLKKKSANKMIIMPGFRGVGKTTVIAQICEEYKREGYAILFLSIEDAKNLFNVGIAELLSAYEELIGEDLENIKHPILLFLDEIQTDPKWAITLKSLFEKTTHIFFCCSGSSAVILQTTTNLARRAVFEKLPPLNFTEFEMIKNEIDPPAIQEKIKHAIYFSETAEEAYKNLTVMKPLVNKYWAQINRSDIRKYLSYGSLPFSFLMPNETAIYDSISLLLDKMIKLDLPALGNFDTETLNAVKRILFAIAENDVTSLATLEEIFHISRFTIANVLDALEKAEVLIKVSAYGSNMTSAKKASKYLFMSPAIRMAFFYFTGLESTYLVRQGKLLEDMVASQLHQEFILKGKGLIRYDSAQGGADFILQILNSKQLIVEVGLGKKDKKQIINTNKKINSNYNLLISNTELNIDRELNIISLPLDYYFLT